MKKIKLLTPLLSAVALSSIVSIASCSCNSTKPTEDTSYIPYEQLDIQGNVLKGLKDPTKDISQYTKLIVPDEVRDIDANAFKDVLANSNIKTLVLKKNIRTIGANAFENAYSIQTIDLSDWTEETAQLFFADADAFKNISGIGKVEFGNNLSDKTKKAIQNKLLAGNLPLAWFYESTDGHATGNKQEFEAHTDLSIIRFELTEAIDPTTTSLVVGIQRVDGTNGVNVIVKNVEVSSDGKSVKVDTQLLSNSELKDGDYVNYKVVITCVTNETQEVNWQQTFDGYKVVYKESEEIKVSPNLCVLEEGDINVNVTASGADIEYSFDGSEWIKLSEGESSLHLKANQEIFFKGYNPDITPENKMFVFSEITTPFKMGGKAMGLYNDGGNHKEVKMPQCAFVQLFKDCTGLVSVDDNFLDETDLNTACYYEMFAGCTNLTKIPNLPAKTLPYKAYEDMFKGCTGLTDASIELSATNLDQFCYAGMFSDCSNIVTGPTINALSLADSCFNAMFYGCSKLESIKLMYSGELTTDNFFNWVSGVNTVGTLYYNGSTTTHSKDAIPTNWVVEQF